MTKYIPALTIAGSDSSGGAGVQADIKTMSALGCYAMSVITAVTAQNTVGVTAVEPISSSMIRAQMEAIFRDIPPKAIKTGMLYDASVIQTVAEVMSQLSAMPPLVVDPVMVATSGDPLLQEEAVESLVSLLLPLATLVTPNLPEAEVLSGIKVETSSDMDRAAEKILALGMNAVLIKGGHSVGDDAMDILYTQNGMRECYTTLKVHTANTHGTGCTLSSAIAAYLAQGLALHNAIEKAKRYLTEALQSGAAVQIGSGHGPVDHFYHPMSSLKV